MNRIKLMERNRIETRKRIGMAWIIMAWVAMAFLASPAQSELLESIEANVNGELILTGEIEEGLRMFLRENLAGLTPTEMNLERRALLQRMIDNMLIVSEVRSRLNQKQKEIVADKIEEKTNQAMANYRSQFTTPADLAREEARMKMSWEDIRRAIYRQNERDYLQTTIVPQLLRNEINKPTEKQLKTFEQENPAAVEELRIQAAHILFRVDENADAEMDAKVKDLAQTVLIRAQAQEPFELLARQFSQDSNTNARGGLLPPFQKGKFLPEFDRLFDMNEGDITGPIRTHLGYHVVKLTRKPSLEDLYLQAEQDRFIKNWIDGLRARATIEIRQDETLSEHYRNLQEELREKFNADKQE